VYIAFVVNFVAMIFLDKLGEPGYAIPGVIAAVLFVLGILNFKEVRNNIASPLILMMAGVIGVAGALANSGFTAMVGDAVAGALGTSVSPFVIVLVFTLLTSLSATFTGASFGSLFVFAPIAISACVSMGLDPTAVAVACVTAAWINWIMPIDGMPAMILGMGKYKLVDFWKFTLPLYVIQILVLCGACVIVFPM
jgi:di/tricarboxylate transporter